MAHQTAHRLDLDVAVHQQARSGLQAAIREVAVDSARRLPPSAATKRTVVMLANLSKLAKLADLPPYGRCRRTTRFSNVFLTS